MLFEAFRFALILPPKMLWIIESSPEMMSTIFDGALGRVVLDAVHHEHGQPDRQLRLTVVRRQALLRLVQAHGLLFFGDQCGDVLSRQGPVHRGAEVEDVGLGGQRLAFDLLRSDIVRRALDARLDRPDPAALAQVDDLDRAALVDQDVVRLDVAVHEPALVHRVQARGHHPKDQQHVAQAQGRRVLQSLALEVLHAQDQFPDLEHASDLLEFVAFSDVGMVDLAGDLVFHLRLFDHAVVFRPFDNNALQSDQGAVFLVRCQIDRAAGPVADPSDNGELPHAE